MSSSKKAVGSLKDPIVLESSDEEENPAEQQQQACSSSQNLSQRSILELKRLLKDRNIDYCDCLEKTDLVQRLQESSQAGGGDKKNDASSLHRHDHDPNSLRGSASRRKRPVSNYTIPTQGAVTLTPSQKTSTNAKRAKTSSASFTTARAASRVQSNSPPDCPIKLFQTATDNLSNPLVQEHCLTLRQMLGLDASHRYKIDCTLEWLVLVNFMVDFDYVLSTIPEFFSIPTCTVFYQQGGGASKTTWRQSTDVDFVVLDPASPAKSATNPLKYKIDWGTHHTKMFLLGLSNGTMRVIIHTANLLEGDQQRKAQGAYIQDFPLKTEDDSSPSSEFEKDLCHYMDSYGYQKKRCWNRSMAHETSTLCEELQRYDFSSAKAVLIPSIPGYHKPESTLLGYRKLSRAIQDYCQPRSLSSLPSQPIVCQFSSIGSLQEKWLKEFSTALNATQEPVKKLEGSLHLVFPTTEEIRNSVEGYAGGGSVPSDQKNVTKAFLQPLFHKWSSTGGSVLAKPRNVPHIKSYYQLGSKDEMQWFCLASHNLSISAWGRVQNNKWGGKTHFIRAWELGVFVAPRLLGDNVSMGPVREGQTLGGGGDDSKGTLVVIPLPYAVQPQKYSEGDEPFSWNKRYVQPDRFGRFSTQA